MSSFVRRKKYKRKSLQREGFGCEKRRRQKEFQELPSGSSNGEQHKETTKKERTPGELKVERKREERGISKTGQN